MPWSGRGIGTYDDIPGQPPLDLQLATASRLVGPKGWVVLFLQPVLDASPAVIAAFGDKLRMAYSHSLRVVVRLGWKGAMVDNADAGSNGTRYTRVAKKLALVSAALPLPPAGLGPLLLHAGNELNACNEWRCTSPAGVVKSLATRAAEVGGFMADTMDGLRALPAAANGSLWLAHASIADWQTDGCECGTNEAVGTGREGVKFQELLVAARPARYAQARWLSSHAYPFSNSNYSSNTSSRAYRGLTYYRAERATVNASAAELPTVLTETGWARLNRGNPVSEADQAEWMTRAARELWAPDPSVLAVCPFLLGGRLWESSGWGFVDCPPANSSEAPCDAPLHERAVFGAWRRAGD